MVMETRELVTYSGLNLPKGSRRKMLSEIPQKVFDAVYESP